MEIKETKDGSKLIICTPKELRKMKASDYKSGDVISCGNYYIYIEYGEYNIPALCTWIEDKQYRKIDCTPGSSYGFTPYYIDDFKGR